MTPTLDSSQRGTLIVLGLSLPGLTALRLVRSAGQYDRVIIVDPSATANHPDVRAFENTTDLKIIKNWLGKTDGTIELTTYNVAGLKSPTPATAPLYDIFPNLQIRNTAPVDMLSAATLKSQIGEFPLPLSIWIDMPGQESLILQELEQSELLNTTTTLALRCGSEIYFDTAQASATTLHWLSERHFHPVEATQDDPDWPDFLFHVDVAAKENTHLRAEISKRDKTLSQRDATLAKMAAAAENLNHDLEAQQAEIIQRGQIISQRDATLVEMAATAEKLNHDLEAQQAEVRLKEQALSKRDTTISDLRNQVQTLNGTVKNLNAETEAKTDELRELHEQVAAGLEALNAETLQKSTELSQREAESLELKAKIDSLNQANEAQQAELSQSHATLADKDILLAQLHEQAETHAQQHAQLQQEKSEAEAEIAARTLRVTALETELNETASILENQRQKQEQAQADLALQMRLQAMQSLDLEELRGRYKQSELQRQQQEDLLRKLTPRLAQAASYLQQLQPSIAGNDALLLGLTPSEKTSKKSKSSKKSTKRSAASKGRKRAKSDAK